MKTSRVCRLAIGVLFAICSAHALAERADDWKSWLAEVDPIMTRLERQTAKLLQTEEDRRRFRDSFFAVRDPDPATPQNEFRIQYEQRLEQCRKAYGGLRSDRGKMILLLGKPRDVKNFSGSDDLVDCEIWSYQSEGRPGLPPFFNLLFFRYHNVGDYQLFQPGIHRPQDLLNPYAAFRNSDFQSAYELLLTNAAELAQASLSIIPGEGRPELGPSTALFGSVMSSIYLLPEREVSSRYLAGFRSPQGRVEVSHSTREITAKTFLASGRQADIHFIYYACTPDTITLKAAPGNQLQAQIVFYLTVTGADGVTVYQNSRKMELRLADSKAAEIREKKILFRDAIPVLPGSYTVALTYINQNNGEFCSYSQNLTVSAEMPTLLFGFDRRDVGGSGRFFPFSDGRWMILCDPAAIYSSKDSVTGIIEAATVPEVTLQRSNAGAPAPISLTPVRSEGNRHYYHYPLQDVGEGNYRLQVREKGSVVHSQPLYLMPSYMAIHRPLAIEKVEAAEARYNFIFILGQERLAAGDAEGAIRFFDQLPEPLRRGQASVVIARAHYAKKEYSRVLELLEADGIEKDFGVLLMLANAALESKAYARAEQYLQQLQRYGDTAELNRLLAAACLAQGKSDQARRFYDRAHQLDAAMTAEKK